MKIAPRILATFAAVAALSACGSGSLPLLPSAAGGAGAEDSRSSAMSAMPYFNVHYVLSPEFKDDLPDSAKAYELEGKTDAAAVTKLAKAFGVTGKVVSDDQGWTVDSDGPQMRVTEASGLPFHLGAQPVPDAYAYACAEPAPPTDPAANDAANGTTTKDAPAPPPSGRDTITEPDDARCAAPPRNPDLPTKSAAEKIARDALDAGGLAMTGARFTTNAGYDSWDVTIEREVDGVANNAMTLSVLVGPKGRILSAYGNLGRPVAVGDYPLVSAAKAVDRLNKQQEGGDGRGGGDVQMGAPEPAIASDTPTPAMVAPVPTCNPAADCVESPIEPVTREVTLTKARLTLTPVSSGHEPNSPLYLLPAFSFTDSDGGEVQIEAVTDRYLKSKQQDDPPATTPPDKGTGGGSPGSPGSTCSATAGGVPASDGKTSTNAPLEIEACASSTKVKVGQEVTFTVTAKDADASFVEGPCEAPVKATFGDESDGDGAVNCMACAQATEGKHEYTQKLTHTFAKPGTYKVAFDVHSGSTCDPRPGDSRGTVALAVEVVG